MLLQENESLEDLEGIVSDLVGRESDEASCLEVLKEVCVQQFEHEAVVLTEEALVNHPHDVVLVLRIFLHDVLQVLGFLVSELVVHLSVTCDLDSQHLSTLSLVVSALYHLGERSLA